MVLMPPVLRLLTNPWRQNDTTWDIKEYPKALCSSYASTAHLHSLSIHVNGFQSEVHTNRICLSLCEDTVLVSLNHARLSHAWIAHKNELEEKVVGFVAIWEDVGSHLLGSEITPDDEGLSPMSKNKYIHTCFWFHFKFRIHWELVSCRQRASWKSGKFWWTILENNFRHSAAVVAGSSSAKRPKEGDSCKPSNSVFSQEALC